MFDSQQIHCWCCLQRIETMKAEDADARTEEEIQADAMKVLTKVLGGDKDSNIAKTLDAHKIID